MLKVWCCLVLFVLLVQHSSSLSFQPKSGTLLFSTNLLLHNFNLFLIKFNAGLGSESWAEAIQQAQQFVANLTIEEKVSLATGVGWQKGPCVGNTPPISRVNFPGLCLEDSPTGM